MNERRALAAALLAFFPLLGLATLSANAATWKTYDPAVGTLPTAQAFDFINDDTTAPAPSVVGGLLLQGPTTVAAVQWWQSTTSLIDFDAGVTLEAQLRVITSNYFHPGPGQQKSGYYFAISDHIGRSFIIGIDSAGITVNTDGIGTGGQGVARTAFDTTSGFHDYRLDVASGVGTLTIDGLFFASTPVNDTPSLIYPTLNDALFGDGSYSGTSQTELSLFRYTATVPEPGTLSLVAFGVASLLITRRRRYA